MVVGGIREGEVEEVRGAKMSRRKVMENRGDYESVSRGN